MPSLFLKHFWSNNNPPSWPLFLAPPPLPPGPPSLHPSSFWQPNYVLISSFCKSLLRRAVFCRKSSSGCAAVLFLASLCYILAHHTLNLLPSPKGASSDLEIEAWVDKSIGVDKIQVFFRAFSPPFAIKLAFVWLGSMKMYLLGKYNFVSLN